MEEQLLLMNEMDRQFRIGDEVEGEILSIKDEQLQISLVDISQMVLFLLKS